VRVFFCIFYFFLSELFAFSFPQDHFFHSEYQVEWIYFVGQVESSNGKKFGYELSFFKGNLDKQFEIFPVHFAISDLDTKKHFTAQSVYRKIGNLVRISKNEIECGDFKIQFLNSSEINIKANPRDKNISIELNLKYDKKDFLFHGDKGYSIKSRRNPEMFSYYYSLPNLKTKGVLRIDGREEKILSGNSWMDHEWSSHNKEKKSVGALSSSKTSWDWVCLNFADGSNLMAFNFKLNSTEKAESFGSYRDKTGKQFFFEKEDEINFTAKEQIWKSNESGKKYHLNWKIKFLDIEIDLEPIFPEQEFIALETTGNIYWEGAILATMKSKTGNLKGQGYLELK
jgi:predicted secreted hydrolase